MTSGQHAQPSMADGPRAVVDPDLPAPVRRRLARLNPAARPAGHLPWNTPVTDALQAIRAAVACLLPLAVNFMLIAVIVVSGRDLEWKHDRMGDMLWLLAGQAAVLLFCSVTPTKNRPKPASRTNYKALTAAKKELEALVTGDLRTAFRPLLSFLDD